ncbi:MAG: preprotein translocase subunit TatC [Phycisphaerales bacterium]|nr:preprotein translocase subunit TatC [Phycisphaerales bacterium]
MRAGFRQSGESGTMSFGDHLEELRRRVFLAVAVPLPLAIILFAFAGTIRAWLWAPAAYALGLQGLPATAQVLSPVETLGIDLKLSLIGAVVIAAPWVFWQAWLFISPGLYIHERRFVHLLLPLSGVLGLAGVALLYFVMLPVMLSALISFAQVPSTTVGMTQGDQSSPMLPILSADPAQARPGQMWILEGTHEVRLAVPGSDAERVDVLVLQTSRPGGLLQQFRLSEYINFVLLMVMCIAVAFQLPVVVLLLGWVGIVTPGFLAKNRRYALAIVAVISALIGPGDAFSMLLFLVPLYILYEFSILLLRIAPAKRVAAARLLGKETGREADE